MVAVRLILRTPNNDLLDQKIATYYDGYLISIGAKEPYEIYGDMDEEQYCFRLSLITLTKGVPPDILQQEFIAELGILAQKEQQRLEELELSKPHP